MAQPEDILKDSKKALKLYDEANWDRFDELCTTEFWVKMVEILRAELVKALDK
jgi:hypothetical protein